LPRDNPKRRQTEIARQKINNEILEAAKNPVPPLAGSVLAVGQNIPTDPHRRQELN